jgi:predicted DsbA family dithiol-disulfide isomerase
MRAGMLLGLLSVLLCSGARAGEKVTVELFVMSKCPFCVEAEKSLVAVVRAMGDTVAFSLDFVGSERDGKLTALHGEDEVKGNLIQICAKRHHPDGYMQLILCMNENQRGIPQGWEQCANRAGVSIEVVKTCAEGEEGENLLRESYDRSKARQALGTPTILINGEPHQGSRSEQALLRTICGAFVKNKPEVCAAVPEPVAVPVIILTDSRCPDCRPETWERMMKGMFPGAKIKVVDYVTKVGRRLYKKIGPVNLPVILFGKAVEKTENYERIRQRLTPKGSYLMMETFRRWDPTKEICDNKEDDDGNGLSDCQDPACEHSLLCRKAEPKKLEVFIMSQCPYAVRGLDAMQEVLRAFENDIKFEVHFIAEVEGEGFRALHGQPEVDEDIRELCVIKYFPVDFRFMDYIWCRNRNIRSDDWIACTGSNGIDTNLIDLCFNGGEGKELLREDIRIAAGLQIQGSPTWVVNGRYKFNGIDTKVIVENFCKHNKEFWGCREGGSR